MEQHPWYSGTCAECGCPDYVIKMKSKRWLCLDCFCITGEPQHADSRIRIEPSAYGRTRR